MKYQTLTVLFSALAFAAAEEIHLVNCDGIASASGFAYYATSPSAGAPSNSDLCFPTDTILTWEGNDISCTFPTGVSATSFIQSDGQEVGDYNYAGSLSNTYEGFNCYKDDNHELFTWPDEGAAGAQPCYSIYYCLPE